MDSAVAIPAIETHSSVGASKRYKTGRLPPERRLLISRKNLLTELAKLPANLETNQWRSQTIAIIKTRPRRWSCRGSQAIQ